MTQFLPIMGGYYATFAPMMGAFSGFAMEGARIVGRTYVANSRASTPRVFYTVCTYVLSLIVAGQILFEI